MKTSSIALGTYNPSQIPKNILLAEFTARQEMLSDILATIRSNEIGHPCQHSLLIGPRGFGKTTSLFAIKYRLEDDASLNRTWIPLLFDEENYQISDLAGFWLECLRLAEKAFGITSYGRYAALSILRDPTLESLARIAFLELFQSRKKRALLLIDNLNEILAIVSDTSEQHRLRALLLEESDVCIVGTASSYFDAIQNGDRPLYNLFRIFRLDRFGVREIRIALEAMWKSRSLKNGILALPRNKGYWTGLQILTGGNPRLVKMIFQLMERGVTPDFHSQLDGLLDAYTPYFKHRIETMSPQQRRIFDAIALAWDPVRLADIAPQLRMDSNQISVQARSLVNEQLVAVVGGSTKRHTYQIADRFSNIYYFMRYSRAGRSKFDWFVLTMKALLTVDQYRCQLDRMREHGLACEDESQLHDQIHLLASATVALDDKLERRVEGHKSIASFLTNQQEAALRHLLAEPSMREALQDEHALIAFFATLPPIQRETIGYQPDDAKWWFQLTDYAEERKLWPIAERAYRQALKLDPNYVMAWTFLGRLLFDELERFDEAENAYRTAIAIDPDYALAWRYLGDVLCTKPEHLGDAEKAYKKAIEITPTYSVAWTALGDLLSTQSERCVEAEDIYRKAISISPKDSYTWRRLGHFYREALNDYNKAEETYRKATEIDPTSCFAWFFLGRTLDILNRSLEAEASYRKASALNPADGTYKAFVANSIFTVHGSTEEAVRLATEAVLLTPNEGWNRIVFEKVAIMNSEATLTALEGMTRDWLANANSRINKDEILEIHRLALNCIASLIRQKQTDAIEALIERCNAQEIFDIPLQAIAILKAPEARQKLASERLALVDEFLKRIKSSEACQEES